MAGYTKLFNSILASTIWRADDKTRIVWITMLAMSDRRGVVEASVPGLADIAHMSIQECVGALNNLMSPDEWSRSKEQDGRRIEVVEGGWRLVNHAKYRQYLNEDERREYLRLKQTERRAKIRAAKLAAAQVSTSVNNRSGSYTPSTQPSPAPSPSPDPKVRGRAPAQPLPDARSKRPIFSGQRLTVFEWMLDDCVRTLGPHLERFDLHEWFFALDAHCLAAGVVVPKRDGGAWLQHELVAEAQKRGLPLVLGSVPKADEAEAQYQAAMKRGPSKRGV